LKRGKKSQSIFATVQEKAFSRFPKRYVSTSRFTIHRFRVPHALPPRQEDSLTRSRCKIHSLVSSKTKKMWHRTHQDTATFSELQCSYRTFLPIEWYLKILSPPRCVAIFNRYFDSCRNCSCLAVCTHKKILIPIIKDQQIPGKHRRLTFQHPRVFFS